MRRVGTIADAGKLGIIQAGVMGSISPIHWLIVAVVLLMLFGPKSLSKVGKTAGRTVRTVTKVKQTITDVPNQVLENITRTDSNRRPPS